MCWLSNKLKLKIAKKDSVVWKVVQYDTIKGIYVSPIKRYRYILDIIYNTSMVFRVNDYPGIGGCEGFHSFSNKVYFRYFDDKVHIYKKRIFAKDKHLFNIYGDTGFDFAIAKGRLPKGTKYAINKNGEIISSSIVIDDFINLQP